MRFIIHQQPYERSIVSGTLQYERDGQPTGAVEHYRMTTAVEGYRFLRVDLDARQAPSRRSTLYHMTLDPDAQPEQLKYRLWQDGLEIAGVVSWDGEDIAATHEVNGSVFEDTVEAAAFWFPSGAGLSLLRPLADHGENVAAVTLEQDTADLAQAMALRPTSVTVRAKESLEVEVTGSAFQAQEYEINWENQQRRVWLHEDGWPVRVWRDDGLIGVARQLVFYQ